MPERVNTKLEGARVEGEPETARRKRSWAVPVLGAVVALLFIVVLSLWAEVSDLRYQAERLKDRVDALTSNFWAQQIGSLHTVDLTSRSLQRLENNFEVAIESVEPKMNGLEVSALWSMGHP